MSCGRCWTMTGTKERFEHCTSKNPFPFLFCVSPASSTTESFFLSLLPLLIAARRIPCSFFSSPLCSPCLPHRLPVSPSVSLFFFPLLTSPPPPVSSLGAHISILLLSLARHSFRNETRGFLRRQQVVTDSVTKLPIKSMFNSDDCRPLTEKVEAFHL